MTSETAARMIAGTLLAAALAACTTTPAPVATTLVGEGGGVAVGSVTGEHPTGKMSSAASGAAIGGMIGSRIGAALDDEDKRRAYAAQMQALEGGPSGAPVAWRNPDSGRYGSVVPGPKYQANGMDCRQFTHTVYLDSKPQTAKGAACRGSDGTWQAS